MRTSNSSLSRVLSFFIFIVIFPCGLSLHVVPGSNCTALCSFQDLSSNTTSDEITCQDKGYENTVVGKTFKDCVTCEFESKSFDQGTGQTDVGWGLYNMRFALNWCLFGTAASTHEPSSIAACDEACQPTKRSLDVNSENSTTPTPYGYCEDLDRIAFTNCAMCYAQVSDHAYLSNFIRVLSSACEWKIIPPTGFPIKGSQVFTHKAPSNYSTLGPNSSSGHKSSSGLSNQSKLAIGIAIPIVLFLILCSLLLFWYFKFHLPDNGKPLFHQPPFDQEPEFQLYEQRRGEKGGVGGTYPSPSPDSPWHDNMNPTIYHPTPALAFQHHTTTTPTPTRHYHAASPPPTPAHLRLHATMTTTTPPRLSLQQQQQEGHYHPPATTTERPKPNIKIETGAIMAAAPSIRSSTSLSPPSRQLSRKNFPPPLSLNPPSAMQISQPGQEEVGRRGRGMEVGVGRSEREMEMGVGGRKKEIEEGGKDTTKRKFQLSSLVGMRGRIIGEKQKGEEKEKKEKNKKRTGAKGGRKKDTAGSEDLFS